MTVMNSAISWTDHTWNWAVGCTPVSAGCDHCYAKALVDRNPAMFGQSFEQVTLKLDRLAHVRRFKPIVKDGRTLPPRVFVNSMSDAWHDAIPTAVIHRVLDVMEANPHIVFQVLTKRPIRARRILTERYRTGFPSHIWIGVSAEDNRVAARLDVLRTIKERTGGGMTAFVSVEPIVGPTDQLRFDGLDWIITGGESGPKARIMERNWLLPAIEQCERVGVALWHKQNGQMRSHPDLEQAPSTLGITARFHWLVDNGWELHPEEKGGASVERRAFRALPPSYYAPAALSQRGGVR